MEIEVLDKTSFLLKAQWIRFLNGQTRNRIILLLFGNASSHGPKKNTLIFLAMKSLFVSETISSLQPLDYAMVVASRSQYWRKKVDLALDNTENNSKLIYDVIQLTGMKWMEKFRKSRKKKLCLIVGVRLV